jgi:hypothetical protein
MDKTTVYLTAELKAGVKRVAALRGVSEAQVIRAAIQSAVDAERPRPQSALFSAVPMAARVDELLDGFGER